MSEIYCRSAPENGHEFITHKEETKYISTQNLNAPKKYQKLSPKGEKGLEVPKRTHLESKTKNSVGPPYKCCHNLNKINKTEVETKNGRKIRPPVSSKCTSHLNNVLNQKEERSRCSQRAPIGPVGPQQCKCSSPHYFNNILNQSEYELADDASKVDARKDIILENANFNEEFELADDAISLNGEIEDRPNSRTSLTSLKSLKNENSFINVNGKEELPSPEQIKNCSEKNLNVELSISSKKTDNSNNTVENKVEIKINDDSDALDGNRNNVEAPPKHFSTLPKRKRSSVNHKMWYRPVLEPPHRMTPDGTNIYYWCDMPKRMDHGKSTVYPIFSIVRQ